MEWFLTEIVPDDHPCLYRASSHSGNTVLMGLLDDGNVGLASMLLDKIKDKKVKLSLLNAKKLKNFNNESIMDYAKRQNIKPIINFVQSQVNIATIASQ